MRMKKGLTTARQWISGKVSQKPAGYSKEENLNRLAGTSILKDFVRENNGSWDHQKWLELCDKISGSGYSPIDFDQVGLILEQEKANFNKVF